MNQQSRTQALSALAEMSAGSVLYIVAIVDMVIVALASAVVCAVSGDVS